MRREEDYLPAKVRRKSKVVVDGLLDSRGRPDAKFNNARAGEKFHEKNLGKKAEGPFYLVGLPMKRQHRAALAHPGINERGRDLDLGGGLSRYGSKKKVGGKGPVHGKKGKVGGKGTFKKVRRKRGSNETPSSPPDRPG